MIEERVELTTPRELAADGLRHLGPLAVAVTVGVLPLSGAALSDLSVSALVGWVGILGALALATLVGHVALTRARGFVSLGASALATWACLLAMMAATMLGRDRESFVTNVWFSVFVSVPVVALATALRVFVPWFQVHVNGEAIRLARLAPQD